MWLLEIVILFGLAFCFVDSNYETTNSNYVGPNSEKEECNNELEFDCFCYDEPGDNNEYSICVDQPKISDPCLSDHMGVNYRMVGERCIYFSNNSTSNYDVARERCKSTFNGKGRMYEPRSFEESNNITKEGEKVGRFGALSLWWLGVNYIYNQRKFVFDSDGSSIPFTPTWHPSGMAWRGPNNCVLGWFQYWNTYSCADNYQMGTLCENGE